MKHEAFDQPQSTALEIIPESCGEVAVGCSDVTGILQKVIESSGRLRAEHAALQGSVAEMEADQRMVSEASEEARLLSVQAIGRLSDHPAGADGLLMPLVGPEFRALAGPPSLASCTRDVYDATLRLTPTAALSMAAGLADALAHLHERGLSHGDLYAHNTLHDGHSQARLGDFGAAGHRRPQAHRVHVGHRAAGRCHDDLMTGFRDRVVGGGEFLRPIPGRVPGAVLQCPVTRCGDDEQDLGH